VVESSLGVPTGCAGKLRWQTAEMFGEAVMVEPWDGVGKAAMAGTHKAQEGASEINPRSMNFSVRSEIQKILTKRSLASEKSTKIAPKLQKFISSQPQLQIK
jgi:hypothetical protein